MSKPSTPKPTTGNNSPAATFSARMQDAQARNKDPYASSSSDSESCSRFDRYVHLSLLPSHYQPLYPIHDNGTG